MKACASSVPNAETAAAVILGMCGPPKKKSKKSPNFWIKTKIGLGKNTCAESGFDTA